MNAFRAAMFSVAVALVGLATATSVGQTTAPSGAAAAGDLKLFDKGVTWEVKKNGKAEGSFDLSTDGDLPIGVLSYDFSKGDGKGKLAPNVVASTAAEIPEGTSTFAVDARSSRALSVSVRFKDAGGQTLQTKINLKGTGSWATLTVPLDKKFEHWGGANDGQVHFPIKQVVLITAKPQDDPPTGKVEFAKARTTK